MTGLRVRATLLMTLALGAALAGCSDHEFHPPGDEERVALADSLYDPAVFDTITWEGRSARIDAGNLVFADECRRCHGALGRGDTEYARAHDLDIPSFVRSDWQFSGRLDSLRHEIFVGHGSGMPGWGIGRLTPREIDAAAYYILYQLRPEVLRDSVRLPTD